MTTKSEFENKWKGDKKGQVEKRRTKLNELGEIYETLDEDGKREHDALATLVANDEDDALSQKGEND